MAYKFTPDAEKYFQWLLSRYPKKDAVLLPLLHRVQTDVGYLSPDAIDYVAERMGLSSARIREVASFYSMFRLNKKGTYVLQVCHNISCYLRGSDEVIEKAKKILGIGLGETTPDGLFTLETVECLASCSTAPAMQVNDWEYHEELSPEKVEKIILGLKEKKCVSASYHERMSQGGVA
jgi:NADH-quinone oxidoreductase subunit E